MKQKLHESNLMKLLSVNSLHALQVYFETSKSGEEIQRHHCKYLINNQS